MREKYESLSLVVLKDLAKARGIKGISTMKKGELIDRMLQEDEQEKAAKEVVQEKEEAPAKKAVFTTKTPSGVGEKRRMPRPHREDHSTYAEDHKPERADKNEHPHGTEHAACQLISCDLRKHFDFCCVDWNLTLR